MKDKCPSSPTGEHKEAVLSNGDHCLYCGKAMPKKQADSMWPERITIQDPRVYNGPEYIKQPYEKREYIRKDVVATLIEQALSFGLNYGRSKLAGRLLQQSCKRKWTEHLVENIESTGDK